jgi:hypothetical protein
MTSLLLLHRVTENHETTLLTCVESSLCVPILVSTFKRVAMLVWEMKISQICSSVGFGKTTLQKNDLVSQIRHTLSLTH